MFRLWDCAREQPTKAWFCKNWLALNFRSNFNYTFAFLVSRKTMKENLDEFEVQNVKITEANSNKLASRYVFWTYAEGFARESHFPWGICTCYWMDTKQKAWTRNKSTKEIRISIREQNLRWGNERRWTVNQRLLGRPPTLFAEGTTTRKLLESSTMTRLFLQSYDVGGRELFVSIAVRKLSYSGVSATILCFWKKSCVFEEQNVFWRGNLRNHVWKKKNWIWSDRTELVVLVIY